MYMYFFFILFFVSLIGIAFMVSKKLYAIEQGRLTPGQALHLEAPNFEEIRTRVWKLTKQLGYFLLVETIRVYVKSLEFAKKKLTAIELKLASLKNRHGESAVSLKRRSNKILKTVSDYRNKIGRIKQEIREEENLN